jgi:allantoinase
MRELNSTTRVRTSLPLWKPAQRFGLPSKGNIAPGYDADIAIVDPHESFVVRAAESVSEQGYSPFEGIELSGRVKSTFLRGALIYDNGNIVGPAQGKYLPRSEVALTR